MALKDTTKIVDARKEKGYLTYKEVNDLILVEEHGTVCVSPVTSTSAQALRTATVGAGDELQQQIPLSANSSAFAHDNPLTIVTGNALLRQQCQIPSKCRPHI